MDSLTGIRKICSLVEVAVVEETVPGDADQGTTHQAVDGCRVEAGGKPIHVVRQIARLFQPAVKTAKRDICEGEEIGELDSPLTRQIRLELLFRPALFNRHEGPCRVRDQVQFKTAARESVADCIEAFEHFNAALPDPFAALGVGLVGIGGRERGRNGHLQLFTQPKKRGISVLEKENQVRTEDEFVDGRAKFLHKIIKVRYQFRRSTGDIGHLKPESPGEIDHIRHGFPTHDFGPSRTGIDMTVAAGKIAETADIDLQGARVAAMQQKLMLRERFLEFHHHRDSRDV